MESHRMVRCLFRVRFGGGLMIGKYGKWKMLLLGATLYCFSWSYFFTPIAEKPFLPI
jgi:hypothetical protein